MSSRDGGGGRKLKAHWGQAAVIFGLLVLPGCNQIFGLDATVVAPNLDPGGMPRNYAILCDIESRKVPRRCASQEEVDSGMFVSKSNAAIALTVRQTGMGNAALDYSADARAACGGLPQVVTYLGAYPEGSPLCVKYLDIIAPVGPYGNPNDVCAAWCNDLHGNKGGGNQAITSFCNAHAGASTSFPVDDNDVKLFGLGGYLGACTAEGILHPEYDSDGPLIDPRRIPEPVAWDPATLVGVSVSSDPAISTLTRTAAFTGALDAGAASSQLITRGDAHVEFTATERNLRRIIGLAIGGAPNPSPGVTNIDFAIELRSDGTLRVLETGLVKFDVGSYSAGQTFRIKVKDNHDGTATVSYATVIGSCVPGAACADQEFYTHAGPAPASYPMHVDSSLFHQGATLTNVRIVRIK